MEPNAGYPVKDDPGFPLPADILQTCAMKLLMMQHEEAPCSTTVEATPLRNSRPTVSFEEPEDDASVTQFSLETLLHPEEFLRSLLDESIREEKLLRHLSKDYHMMDTVDTFIPCSDEDFDQSTVVRRGRNRQHTVTSQSSHPESLLRMPTSYESLDPHAITHTHGSASDLRNIKALQRRQFYKTRLCPHFFSETTVCRMKHRCNYAHSQSELRPSVDLTNTKLCPNYAAGYCGMHDCPFAHGVSKLKVTPSFFKTQFCKYWEAGHCPVGPNCRHAHGKNDKVRLLTSPMLDNVSQATIRMKDKEDYAHLNDTMDSGADFLL